MFDWEAPDSLDCGVDSEASLSDDEVDLPSDPDPIVAALVAPHCCTRSVESWVEVENTGTGAVMTLCSATVSGPREFECTIPAGALGAGTYLVRVHHRAFADVDIPPCCAEQTEGFAVAPEELRIRSCGSMARGNSNGPGLDGGRLTGETAAGPLSASDFTIVLSELKDGDPLDDDLGTWLPEACPIGTSPPPDCDSAAVGRRVKIIVTATREPCAVDAVTLSLGEVSSYPGIAMNYNPAGRLPGEADVVVDGPTLATFDSNWRAEFTLSVRDYAARAQVLADVFDQENPTAPPIPLSLWIPLDEDGNRIADTEWISSDDQNIASERARMCEGTGCASPTPKLVTCKDNEVVSPIANGDGFTNWEEYRGVICQDAHRRLNPNAGDLFMAATPDPHSSYPTADWFARVRTLPTREHRLQLSEFASGTRRIKIEDIECPDPAADPDIGLSTVPRQLLALVDLAPSSMPPGYGKTVVADPCPDGVNPDLPPKSRLNCEMVDATCRINIRAHQFRTPPNVVPPMAQAQAPTVLPLDPLDVPALQHTIAHEVGHALGINHYCLNCQHQLNMFCNAPLQVPVSVHEDPDNCAQHPICTIGAAGCPDSVMVTEFEFARPCCIVSPCGTGPWWTNMPAGYASVDRDVVRIW